MNSNWLDTANTGKERMNSFNMEREMMNSQLGVVTAMHCYLRKAPGSSNAENGSGIEDEIFSGWAVRRLEEPDENGWVKIETHYGYEGYVNTSEFREIQKRELEQRQSKEEFFRISIGEADLLTIPKVQGLPLELLMKNAIVQLLEWEETTGWSRIRTAAGREGYVHTKYLSRRMDDDAYLLSTDMEELDRKQYFLSRIADQFGQAGMEEERSGMEEKLRVLVTESAKAYLATQYRWGGKSSQGIDCSGLVFMSYMEHGILIYRDGNILPDYPVHEIDRSQIRQGDLLFFPGHVAMYLGDGKYIHSTAFDASPCVRINSLKPEDEDYREDLDKKMTRCGSIF